MGFKAPVAARLATAGLILAGWAASAGLAGADPEPSPPPSTPPSPVASPSPAAGPPPAADPSPAPAAGPKTTIDKDGIYAVGTDIVPGVSGWGGGVGCGPRFLKGAGDPEC